MYLLPHSPPDCLRHSLAYGQNVRSSQGEAWNMRWAYTTMVAVASLAETCRKMAGVKENTVSWRLSMWHGLAYCGLHAALVCDIQVSLI